MSPEETLIFVQRAFLDLLSEHEALRQELTEAQMATGVAVAERNVAIELLQAIRPVVAERKLAAMCESSSDEYFRFLDGCLKRIDVALGIGGVK